MRPTASNKRSCCTTERIELAPFPLADGERVVFSSNIHDRIRRAAT